jgi:hypothetical protein
LQCSKNNLCRAKIRQPDGTVVASIEAAVSRRIGMTADYVAGSV